MSAEFLAMGGHGAFIWPAYGLTFAVMLGLALGGIAARRAARARLDALERESGGAGGSDAA
ncbi:MAG: heme exporter protein CcmD [Alphaproteobacteria bacterium]|nr:heme exporter protein CcmD [Alphaproteobacteria bacterium]